MSAENKDPLDEIWADDLLSRRAEAQLLVDYIECAAQRPSNREDVRSFSLAIDVGYGEGKTFFLKRLAKHLATRHPVALVDAWADDIANEPLTALTATLKRALDPLKTKQTIKAKFGSVLSKASKVAEIVAVGAMKRGAAYLISEGAVGAVDETLKDAPDIIREAAKRAADVGGEAVSGGLTSFAGIAASNDMRQRITDFERGKAAVEELKGSLSALVTTLSDQSLKPPIVVIVDELDRCRPTYAIKLLEEIKHLFDVPGLVFVFGMHGEQLSHSVSAAYGERFDGKAYLRRFVSRRYRLKQPDLEPLLAKLLGDAALNAKIISPYFAVSTNGMEDRPQLQTIVAKYMKDYALSVRDAYHVVDMLQTCAALAGGQTLYAPYLLPMLMSRIQGAEGSTINPPIEEPDWAFVIHNRREGQRETYSPATMAKALDNLFKLSSRDLHGHLANANDTLTETACGMKSGTSGLSDPSNYGLLLDAVGRFSNPRQPEQN